MMKNRILIIILIGFIQSCGNPYKKLLQDFQNLPTPDYSYVVEPVFKDSIEVIEFQIKELYQAEKVKFGVSKFHGYDNETMEQIDEEFWINFSLLNSNILDINNKQQLEKEGREIAKIVMDNIENKAAYDKIQINFLKQWNDGSIKQIKYPITYTYPELELLTFD